MSKFGGQPVEERSRATSKFGGKPVDEPRSLIQSAANVANDINYGITSAVPGLNYFTSKLGVGEDIPRGENGEVTPGQEAARYVGQGASYLTMGLAAPLRNLNQYAEVARPQLGRVADSVKNFLDQTAQLASKKPGAFFGSETAAAASAGGVGQFVENEGGTPAERAGAEVVTGLLTGGAYPLAQKAADFTLAGQLLRRGIATVKSLKAPPLTSVTSGTPGAQRAATRVRGAIPDTEGFLNRSRTADVDPDVPLSVGERAEEPGLLALERAVRDSSEDIQFREQARFDEINQIVRSKARALEDDKVDPEVAREYLNTLLDKRIEIAGVKLEERLQQVSPKTRRADANTIARETLDRAYDDALKQERELWGAVPKNVRTQPEVATEALRNRLAGMQDDRVRQTLNKLPGYVKKFLGRFNKKGNWKPGTLGEGATVEELQSLRSALLRQAREERAKDAPDREMLGILHDVQEALLTDMAQASDDGSLELAINFSRDLNTKFRQGDVGVILGFDRTGEGTIAPILTLERTLGQTGKAGATAKQATNELLTATQNDPQMRSAMEDYLRDEFLLNARTGNDFNPRSAQRYIDSRKELLDQFPGLKREFQDTVELGNANQVAQNLKRPSQTPAAIILGAPPGKFLDRIVSSAEPEKVAKDLMETLSGDQTGRALPAMRRATIDWLMDQASTRNLDSLDQPIVSGVKMRNAMADPAYSKALKTILTPEQLKRLETLTNTALAAERGRTARPTMEGVLQDKEGMILETVRRVVAAGFGRNIGRKLGMGGTVQIPGQFVKFSERLRAAGLDPARKLIIDAVTAQDDKLLRSILRVPQTPVQQKMWRDQMNAWMAATAKEYGMSLSDDEE